MSTEIITVFCDLSAVHHASKPHIPVAGFRYIGGGRWTGHITSRWLRRKLQEERGAYDTGVTLYDDAPRLLGSRRRSEYQDYEIRHVHRLECFACHTFTTDAREGTLFAFLNSKRHAGVSSVPLRELAATFSSRERS